VALFVLTCIDRQDALEARMGARPAHLEYVDQNLSKVKLAGPFLDEAGGMVGSMFILETEDQGAAEAFAANDPYALAGVFERTEVRPFKIVRGALA
jgi:uncharacterized protein